MNIRERIENLEAEHFRLRQLRPERRVFRLTGLSDEEAWRLSGYSGRPLGSCMIFPEELIREQFSSATMSDKLIRKVRCQHEAIRQGRPELAPWPEWFQSGTPEGFCVAPEILEIMNGGEHGN